MSNLLFGLGRLSIFVYKILLTILNSKLSSQLVINQMYQIGIRILPVLIAVCIFVGTNIALVGYQIFKQFGGQDLIGAYVGLACVREMAPILVGSIMAAKPGTDITGTIATMRVKEQIDALEVMAVDPFWFLLAPRLIAFICVAPFLVILADFFCVSSAYFVAVFQLDLTPGKFTSDLVAYLEINDLYKGMIKGSISAFIVCTASSYFGFYSQPGPKGVSRAINTAIVLEASLIVIVNYFLTELLYGKI